MIHRRTEGHPLFVVNLVDYALRERLLAEEDGVWRVAGGAAALESTVPDTLRQMIERQIEALGADDQRLLEAVEVVSCPTCFTDPEVRRLWGAFGDPEAGGA